MPYLIFKQDSRVAMDMMKEEEKEDWRKHAYVAWMIHNSTPLDKHLSLNVWYRRMGLSHDEPDFDIKAEIKQAYENNRKVREAFDGT